MKQLFALLLCFGIGTFSASADDRADVAAVLDQFHTAAANADWGTYFGLMHADSIFIGTDASERWDKPTFEGYASNTNGWKYTPYERNVDFTPDGNTAWFDELTKSESYGTSRGTGVLIRTSDGWRILQYHLTFPIPNDLAKEMTSKIIAHEAKH